MLGFKNLKAAAIKLSGIELIRMLRKSQLHPRYSNSKSVTEQFGLLPAQNSGESVLVGPEPGTSIWDGTVFLPVRLVVLGFYRLW